MVTIVRERFGPIATTAGVKEIRVAVDYVAEEIFYASETHVLDFALDVRDGYLDVRYGLRRLLNASWFEWDSSGSIMRDMLDKGIDVPSGPDRLYVKNELTIAIDLFIKEIKSRCQEVLGVPSLG